MSSSSSSSTTPTREGGKRLLVVTSAPFDSLPNEVVLAILRRTVTHRKDVGVLRAVSRRWRMLVNLDAPMLHMLSAVEYVDQFQLMVARETRQQRLRGATTSMQALYAAPLPPPPMLGADSILDHASSSTPGDDDERDQAAAAGTTVTGPSSAATATATSLLADQVQTDFQAAAAAMTDAARPANTTTTVAGAGAAAAADAAAAEAHAAAAATTVSAPPHTSVGARFLNQLSTKADCISSYFTAQVQLAAEMRPVLVDWLHEVADEMQLLPETTHKCVAYIDAFLGRLSMAHRQVARVKLQLVGVTCLYIAAKFEEVLAPIVADMIFVSADLYTPRELLDAEALVVAELGFETNAVTTWGTLYFLLEAAFSGGCLRHITAGSNSSSNAANGGYQPSARAPQAALAASMALDPAAPAAAAPQSPRSVWAGAKGSAATVAASARAVSGPAWLLSAAEEAMRVTATAAQAGAVPPLPVAVGSERWARLVRAARVAADCAIIDPRLMNARPTLLAAGCLVAALRVLCTPAHALERGERASLPTIPLFAAVGYATEDVNAAADAIELAVYDYWQPGSSDAAVQQSGVRRRHSTRPHQQQQQQQQMAEGGCGGGYDRKAAERSLREAALLEADLRVLCRRFPARA